MTDLAALESKLIADVGAAADLRALEDVRIGALGKKGRVAELMQALGGMAPESRKSFGQAVNGLRDRVMAALETRKAALGEAELAVRLAAETADVGELDATGAAFGRARRRASGRSRAAGRGSPRAPARAPGFARPTIGPGRGVY